MTRARWWIGGTLAMTGALVRGADAPTLGGRVFSDFYVSTFSTATPFPQVSTTGWLGANAKLDTHAAATLLAEGRLVDSSTSQPRAVTNGYFSVREGYFSYSAGALDLAVGKQILPWGKTDVVTPTDFLTGHDYTLRNPDPEVQRLGSTAIQASYTWQSGSSSWTLTGVVIPLPAFSVLLLPPGLLPAGVTTADLVSPAASFANAEAALRLSYFGEGWDFALIGFHGWQRAPEYSSSINGTTVTLAPAPHRINAVGIDASWAPGRWVFRGESAFVSTENSRGTNSLVQPSYLESVLGAEYALSEDWHVQAQVIDKVFPHPLLVGTGTSVTDQIQQAVSILNAELLGYKEANRVGGTARIRYRSEKAGWDAEIFAMAYTPSGYLLRPKLGLDLTESLKASFGAEYYGGDSTSQLGALSAYNAVFLEGKYTF